MDASEQPVESMAVEVRIDRRDGANLEKNQSDWVATEEPLEIRTRGETLAVTMRTPGHDAELTAGFLFTEGVIKGVDEILDIAHCPRGYAEHPENVINAFLVPSVDVPTRALARFGTISASCGICGKTSIESIHQQFPPLESEARVSSALLESIPDLVRKAQATFSRTGGLHAAALLDANGGLLVLREDVGRHNAVDKAIGHLILNRIAPDRATVLFVSGRASFEIMQKALSIRVPVIAAVSAPSSLAVTFARESRQTLVGFLRAGRMNVYSELERIIYA